MSAPGSAGAPALPPAAQAVLDFWFGAPGSPAHGHARPEWFRKDDAFDAHIARVHGPLIESALAGGLREWMAAPGSALARVLLLDQFTRNVYRGTPRAFAGDALALEAARAMVAHGADRALAPLSRAFVYLPFEHAEDPAAQDEAVRQFEALLAEAPAQAADLAGMLDYARRHHAVIARFGRFPHRNEILGRATTPEEAAFLAQPGSRF